MLSALSSITFPTSFPYDFMHLVYESLIKNLVLLWTSKFKHLDESTGKYQLTPPVWKAIGAATAASGTSIPGAFGARPQNIANSKYSCTADMWSFWILYIGPILLAKRFHKQKYYNHFVQLVVLINMCLQFEIKQQDIDFLQCGFQEWVLTYEKCVFFLKYSFLTECSYFHLQVLLPI